MQSFDLGIPVDDAPRPFPGKIPYGGRSVRLEPLSIEHVESLWLAAEGAETSWTFLRYGPFPTRAALATHIVDLAGRNDQPFFAVLPKRSGVAEGWLSLCDVYPENAAIEVGSIWFSPLLQRSRAATESIFLLMRHVFDDLGYRRLVWRCHAQNVPSRKAALRYGFTPEGVWRAGAVVKGWQRDVAWHSMLAPEWPAHKAALLRWLDDTNFDRDGRARMSLADIRKRA
jgi:RimJ/RimL family protein N-acetyltransferase